MCSVNLAGCFGIGVGDDAVSAASVASAVAVAVAVSVAISSAVFPVVAGDSLQSTVSTAQWNP